MAVEASNKVYWADMTTVISWDVWHRYQMALDAIAQRMQRIAAALTELNVPFAIVGGQAVILWVSTKDPEAVRTTKDVDILVDRSNLGLVRKAGIAAGLEYHEVLGVGMLLEKSDPNPKKGVHLLWANEKVRADNLLPAPSTDRIEMLSPGLPAIDLVSLVTMKLQAYRDHDRTHLRDMIGVELIDRSILTQLPPQLAKLLEPLLDDAGK
jgi:hypothetical protein